MKYIYRAFKVGIKELIRDDLIKIKDFLRRWDEFVKECKRQLLFGGFCNTTKLANKYMISGYYWNRVGFFIDSIKNEVMNVVKQKLRSGRNHKTWFHLSVSRFIRIPKHHWDLENKQFRLVVVGGRGVKKQYVTVKLKEIPF